MNPKPIGAAILDACRQLNERLAPFKTEGRPWKDTVNAAYMSRVDLSAHGFYLTPDISGGSGTRPFNYYTFGAAVSEVPQQQFDPHDMTPKPPITSHP